MYKKIYNKIKNLIKFGYVSLETTDSGDYPVAQVTYFGKTLPVEIITPYGLYVNLPENTKVVLWNINANEENQVAIGFSQQDRFKNLESGEVLVGNPKTGSYIKLKANGSIEIESKDKIDITVNGEVDIDAAKINLGSGGARIARLGDEVTVGSNTGTITGAGVNTSL